MKTACITLTTLVLASLGCSLVKLPTLTPPPMPTVAVQTDSQPKMPSSAASLDPRALDTAGMEECNLLADADFSALLGQAPADKVPEAEVNKTACYYNFSGGQMVSITFITNQPGKQAYDGVMQYLDAAQGAEVIPLGEIAVLSENDGIATLHAVINGWYLNLTGRGFERQAIINLARLFEARLTPYPQQSAAEPTAPPADQNPPAPGAAQCQNPYYPIVEGASWQYQLSGVSSDTFTRTLTAVRSDGFDDQDVFSAGTTRTASYACQNGNLISLTPSSGPTVSTAEMQFDFTVEANDGITFPADPQPGQTWTQNVVYLGQQNAGGMTIESRNVLATSCKAGNIETVNVPAGEFQALRVDCSTTIDVYILGNLAFSFSTADSVWYAPGVGMIKSSGSSDMGTTEIVLLSYHIP